MFKLIRGTWLIMWKELREFNPSPFPIALGDAFFANEQTQTHSAEPVKQYVKYLGILLHFNRFRVILH